VTSAIDTFDDVAMDYRQERRRAVVRLPPVRLAAPALYAVTATVVFVLHGIPLERGLLSVWILGLLLCFSLGNLRSFGWSVLVEWIPLLAALTLYDIVRGLAAGLLPEHAEFQIWIDRAVGLGSVPTVWLQAHLWNPAHVSAFDVAAWSVYMSYFLVTPTLLAALWLVDRPVFRSYARRLTLLSFAAAAFFLLLPSMPPWLASQKGLIGTSDRLIGPIGRAFPWFDGSTIWERGLHLANDLAAFPSLHEGMTVLVAVMLWRRVPRWARVPLALYPVAMAFALVYAGEHYVTDLVAGALLAFAVVRVEPWLMRRLRPWAAGRAAQPVDPACSPRNRRRDRLAWHPGARPNT
jgi:membrane-associated phospholipid phosphatase